MKKWYMLGLIVLGMLLLSACGEKKYAALPINEEVDICVICNMQVKDDAFATQLTTKDGKNYKFDDIGCMNKWKEQNGSKEIGMDYVRDYNDKEWIEFSKASYVYDESLRTPMAYGVISFKDAGSAEAFVKEQGLGTVLTAGELASHEWTQNQNMMNMDMMNDEEHKDGEMSDDMESKDADKGMDMDK
ncbi:nitrous oxide reductase accessory protein NosL [Paenibacillus sp. 19GGS1-52]|uniref:nitrous oxide reductase accessory protein NosL n=1 Tax=Paenibacillus sp. 19GGS1-52 TaxID=2758563 RepID=UPI001EFA587D|nr:nitrous oxide reductase accessory protein NosL [Paenibacillus sp. 19GGS1-52]ULO05616.1 nitrous oxide reductase accessory protein NosL [Paenibacillus sp. 19GGS1-52]